VPIVSVSGACSRAGKTALAVTLLEAVPRGAFAAVKFTTTEDVFQRCPRGAPCVVCDIDVPFRIVEDEDTLRQAGTDTDRLAGAGASRVIWAIAKGHAARAAWERVEGMLGHEGLAVVEGSSVVGLARLDLRLFVVHPFLSVDRWKPTSGPLIADADVVVVNRPEPGAARPADEARPPDAGVLAEVERFRAGRGYQVADVTRPLASWAPGLLDALGRMRSRAGAAG
jgi:hypothetical protein